MRSLLLVISAGACTSVFASDVTPERSPRGTMPSRHVAHIYYNMATGERVATLIAGGVRPADNGVSPTVWVSDNEVPCAGFGQTSGTIGVMDSPACSTCHNSTATNVIYLDWADIASDQVIDCVGVTWSTQALDTDTDSDGVGDGVEGFAGTWVWFDADDGFDSSATRIGLTGFTLLGLAGNPGPFDPNEVTTYTATVDLAATFSSSIVFELGDTDSTSDAAIFNAGSFNDLDSDGNHDFSYAFLYTQPGTFDFDNADGDSDTSTGVDGDPNNQALNGWTLTTGNGDVSTDGSTYTPEASAPSDVGAEDAFDFFIDSNSDGLLEPIGTFWYGGFACDIDGNGTFEPGPNSNPWAQFYMQMYGPGGSIKCPADLNCDGLLNFFDIEVFIAAYNAGSLAVADLDGNGLLNFFDVNAYITAYTFGCP